MSKNKNHLLFKIVFIWIGFIPVAITNGIVRNSFYQPIIGELPAHQLSTLIGIVLFFLLVYFSFRKEIFILSTVDNLLIGFSWVIMTISFEFLFGHYIAGHSWEKLFFDYNILAGRVWTIFLLNTLLTPLFIKYLKGRKI